MNGTFMIDKFITNMIGIVESVLMIEMMIVFQHIFFLEHITLKQKKILRIIIGVYVLFAVVIYLIESGFGASNLWVIFAVLSAFFILVPSVYHSVAGRKKAKWLGVLIPIPLTGYYNSIFELLNFPITVGFIPKEMEPFYDIIVYLVILGVLALLMNKKPRFIRRLERDIENRTLKVSEEIGLWFLGIWLFVYALFFPDLFPDILPSLNAYLSVSNFVVAAVIVLLIVDSNYRNFYYKQNTTLQKSLITTMADLVENRDENTGGHIQRTAKYVEIIARKLKSEKKYPQLLTDKYIEDMVIAAPLHDVGKIHIPDAVLNKPGKLDDSEFAMMKSHAAEGGKIIDRVEESVGDINYLRIAKQMAEYHHERMDGKGYPHGITGDEIPLCAKILAVADVFDALISKRCYKEPMPLDKAFSIIAEESGSHFDTDVANAFLESRSEIEQYIKELVIE